MESNNSNYKRLSLIRKAINQHKVSFRITAMIVGGLIGFAFYYFIGCRSGSCPLASNPYLSTFWGALLGLILFW